MTRMSIREFIDEVKSYWQRGISERDTAIMLASVELTDHGVVSDMEPEDAVFDTHRITVHIDPVTYELGDGRIGSTSFLCLVASPDEGSWGNVRIGDRIQFVAQIADLNNFQPPVHYWEWAGKGTGAIYIDTKDAKCVSLLEKAVDRSADSPLVPFQGQRLPEIDGDDQFQLQVASRDELDTGILTFWKRTLDAFQQVGCDGAIIELHLRTEYGEVRTYMRKGDGKRTILAPLVRLDSRSIIRDFANCHYDLGLFHQEWVRHLAEALDIPALASRLRSVYRELAFSILAMTTDDFEVREFVELWPQEIALDFGVHHRP